MTSVTQTRSFGLSADQHLCLAYAKATARGPLTALFAVDHHLERIALGVREPMVARIKLAWWREHGFAQGLGDLSPELAVLSAASDQSLSCLCRIAEGWDAILATWGDESIEFEDYARGRGAALFELAGILTGKKLTSNQTKIGEAWALADLSAKLPDPKLISRIRDRAACRFQEIGTTDLRALPLPLGILAVLARSDATRGARNKWRAGSPMRIGRAALFGLFRF